MNKIKHIKHIKRTYYSNLSLKNKDKQLSMIRKSRKMYKKGEYFNRKKLNYPVKVSPHIIRAQKIYGTKIIPSKELAQKTGCSINALKQIVKKGQGAYYSSGSRPSQTSQSWAYARLASAISGGKASKVDFHILKTCDRTKKAYQLSI
jgi:hypothetical protein